MSVIIGVKPGLIKKAKRKSLVIKPSERSTDFISPSFGFGCVLDCSYCYCKRHKFEGVSVATNDDEILAAIQAHRNTLGPKIPNQTSEDYWTYDIGCNEDFVAHMKYHNWGKVLKFSIREDLMFSFATKIVEPKLDLLSMHIDDKIRIRYSLMPQKISSILEPKTSLIVDRIRDINIKRLFGYDVHINFSPIVVYPGWQKDYAELFEMIDKIVDDKYKDSVKAECIFLTHNENKHLNNPKPGEEYLWTPHNQEAKTSQYGGKNVRYHWQLKEEYKEEFIEIHDEIIPWNEIRYIF